MKSLTKQDIVELTPEQAKAFNRFVKAGKDFIKAGGAFYTVLDTIHGYNRADVKCIEGDDHRDSRRTGGSSFACDTVSMPSFTNAGLSGFADDRHIFIVDDNVTISDEEDDE